MKGITQFEDRKRLEGKGSLVTASPASRLNAFNSSYVLVVHDWDADGRLDLLATVISGGQPSLVLYPQTTAGAFGAEQLLFAGGGASLVADLNADGLPDLVSGATIRLAEEGGAFASPRSYHLPGSFVFPVWVADLNGDGRPDLISAEDLTDNVSILLHR